MAVFVLSKTKQPLMPCSEKRARLLLERKRAVVVKLFPFTIRLRDRVSGEVEPLRLKLDPGSKTTGVALVREVGSAQKVLFLAEIAHRGKQISEALAKRAAFRRRRRNRLRYRPARFDNRTKKAGWLAPSLQHRIDSTLSLVNRLMRLAPITAISQELVRFDMQLMQNPDISGVEYQHGALAGYEVREYLLEKWGRKCAYCGAKNVPLEVEHIVPRSKGGSSRPSNLAIACTPCNQAKDNQPIEVFLTKKPEVLRKITAQAKASLKDAAAVNSTRWALYNALQETNAPVAVSTGGRTKFNRSRLEIPKTHALDAACVGEVEQIKNWNIPTLQIKCNGRGSYQRTRLDAYGFPRGYLMRHKAVRGFQTGDIVKADVPRGKKTGSYIGRVAVRASGSFNIQMSNAVVQGISHKYCRIIQRNDGYGYFVNPKIAEQKKGDAGIGVA